MKMSLGYGSGTFLCIDPVRTMYIHYMKMHVHVHVHDVHDVLRKLHL